MKGRAGGGSSQKGPAYLSEATSQPCEAGAAGLSGASLPPGAPAAVGGGSTAHVAPLPRVRGGRAHIPHAPTGAGSSLLSLRPGERITAKRRSFSQFRSDVSHPRRKLSLALGAIQPGCGESMSHKLDRAMIPLSTDMLALEGGASNCLQRWPPTALTCNERRLTLLAALASLLTKAPPAPKGPSV